MEEVIIVLMGSVSSSDPDVILGAIAGSMIFVISADDFNVWIRAMLFISSFFIGVLSAEFVATILSHWVEKLLVANAIIPLSMGATVSSVAAVRLLMFLCIKPEKRISFIDFFLKRGDK